MVRFKVTLNGCLNLLNMTVPGNLLTIYRRLTARKRCIPQSYRMCGYQHTGSESDPRSPGTQLEFLWRRIICSGNSTRGELPMPDARGGYGAEQRSIIFRAVREAFKDKENQAACNKFVANVVSIATKGRVSFPKGASANEIFDLIQNEPWQIVGRGIQGYHVAGVIAGHEGKLVVAAWKSPPSEKNGHCAIVLDFTNSKSADPNLMRNRAVIAQGVLHHPEKARQYAKISIGFSEDKLKNCVYSCVDVA
ncbi:hypothetical protein [Paraburkholderia unamae]|uniref:hypothetical protein n=1 Tax=Paraburkholderia unamae TaxID=219649 RepID=UPI001CC3B1E4|nr:hypothetical protein [Paraburkholderia unamae]